MIMKNKGFTMIELLIAVTLMAILLTATVGIVGQFTGSMSRNKQVLGEAIHIYAAMDRLEKDITSYLTGFESAMPVNLQFIGAQNTPLNDAKRSGQLLIRYDIQLEDEVYTLTRFEKDAFHTDDFIETELLTAPQIYFTYIDSNGKVQQVWDIQRRLDPPIAVSIHVKDMMENEWVRTIPVIVRSE